MATKVAHAGGAVPQTPHTSGLYADMTLDGPEIGTLVIVFDRAKNLPNRKTMGKQNPYCAARLGKEAKKTETDRRGGQTPRWDQELRFIVHDSPDYHRIKISVFSEDKRTDLIGEAWVDLTQVIVPGGGKSDLWQNLTFKGKYAGELRIELTYYDERPKPSEIPPWQDLALGIAGDASKVKRRPLPSNPALRNLTPDTIPDPTPPGRAKHGPRDFRTPPRSNSMPPEVVHPNSHWGYAAPTSTHGPPHGSSPAIQPYQTPPHALHRAQEESHPQQNGSYALPEFLPELPPSHRPRGSLPMPHRLDTGLEQSPAHPFHGHSGLQHSHSSPAVPTTYHALQGYDDGPQLRTDYPEPIPDLEYQYQQLDARPRTSDAVPDWPPSAYSTPYSFEQPTRDDEHHPPPPPPVHSNSSPAVPQRFSAHPVSSPASPYGTTSPSARHHSIPTSSPLQNLERKYMTPPRPQGQGPSPGRGQSFDPYTPSPEQPVYSSPPFGYASGQNSSPQPRPQPAPRPTPNRHSIADPYYTGTPPRPHPLSNEVSQSHSPPQLQGSSPQTGPNPAYQTQYRSRDGLPLMKPRPVSPQASSQPPSQPHSEPRSRSLYDIQFPIRAFESSENSPLSNSQPKARGAQLPNASTPMRKSISPHPTPPASAGAVPYSPDSFNIHNPNAQSPMLPTGNSPHSPYQIRPGSEATPRDNATGPIVDSHGNEIDPSDRLPMNSWAPEPEKKTPVRTYGLGRDREFGPRSPQSAEGKNIPKDTVVNVRSRAQTQPASGESTPLRNRLQKKSTPNSKTAAVLPLQERPNYNSTTLPNSYEHQDYNRGMYGQPYEQTSYGGSYAAMSEDALSREISSIDIGGARHVRSGSVPAPTAYVPVRSHKDRRTLY